MNLDGTSRGDPSSPGMLEVNVPANEDERRALKEGIEAVTPAAIRHGVGILVTEITAGRYIVRAHPAVPSGYVRESRNYDGS